jgi:hypothetical protein
MSQPTQLERLVALLRAAGDGGLTQLEVLDLRNERPILALSQRIGDLRRAGYPIESRRERTPGGANIARYVLTGEPMRATFGSTPPETSCKTPTAHPEDRTLVHVTRPHAGSPA